MTIHNETSMLIRLSTIVSFAENIPLDIVTQRNPEPTYPVTIGEHIVSYALNIVLQHDWESIENELAVGPMLDVLHLLDTGVDRPEAWKSLFNDNHELIRYIESKEDERSE